jgi:hypothetical protein
VPWKADLADPTLAWAVAGIPMVTRYTAGLFAAALSTLSTMVFIMAGNVSRDLVKLWRPETSDKALIWLMWILLAICMGFAAIGLRSTYIWITAVCYHWKGASALGMILTMFYGLIATLWGVWGAAHKTFGMGTMFWIVFFGCAVCYVVGSFISPKPDAETLATALPERY